MWKFIGAQKLCADTMYRRSRFVVAKKTENHLYLFHTLTKQCYQTDRDLMREQLSAEEIENNPDLKKLTEEWFYVKQDYDESRQYFSVFKILRAFRAEKGFVHYLIYPTSKCNARCVYCIEEDMKKRSMKAETARQAAAYIASTHRKGAKICLTWWGGEPLIEEKKIDLITEYLQNEKIDYFSNMITNGSLINERIIHKMHDLWKMDLVQISMDCGEQEYIRRKNYYSYHNEYFTIMEKVNELVQNDVGVMVRVNVDMDNIAYAEEFIRDLKKAVREPSKVPLYFAPLHQSRAADGDSIWKNVFRLDHVVREEGFANRFEHLPNFFTLYKCMSDGQEGVVIDTEGRLLACEACVEGTSFGDVWNGVVDKEMWNSHNEICEIREECKTCVCLPLCTPFSKCPHVQANCKALPMHEIDMGLERIIAENE